MNAPVRHLVDIYVLADQTARQVVDLQSDTLAILLQRQILCDVAFVAEAEDLGQPIWDQIKAIRTASNALEPMDPIPADYADDSHWP